MFYEVDFRNYGSTTRSCVVRMKRNKKSEKKNQVDLVARQLGVERAVYVRELWKRLQIKEIHMLTQQFLKFKASFIDSLGKKVIVIFLTKSSCFEELPSKLMHPSLKKLMLPPLIS